MACLHVILPFLTFSLIFINCQQLIQVQQEPKDMVLFPGSSLKVSCFISGTSNPDLFWYHWNETTGFTLVFTSRGAGMMDPATYNEFKSRRPKDLEMILESDGVSEIGSAVWYCAARQPESYNNPAYFGLGTKVTVIEPGHEITKPTVRVLNVSPNELCVKENVTLVCVAEGFYPDHVDVYWTVGDENRTSDVSTDQAATRKGKFYSISSRLNINYKDEWTKGHKFTCTVQFFDGKAYSDHSHSIDGPNLKDNDVEGHVRSVNTMLMAYGMFIAKSIAYGLFILYIIKRQGFMSK